MPVVGAGASTPTPGRYNPAMPLAAINLAAAAALTGVIWLVQLVVYPMFLDAGPGAFPAWELEHAERISPVVGVPIVAGLAAAVALVVRAGPATRWLARVNLGLLVLALGITALVSVPLHEELSRGFSAAAIDDLVRTNWIRTAAWSAQLAVAVLLVVRFERGPRLDGR